MNNTPYANEIPTLKREHRRRMIAYHHVEVLKKKFAGLKKHQCRWQERQGRCN